VQTRHDGRSSGFALVSYESIEHAQYAINTMNGQDIGGRPCVCRYDRG
jgi:RNA recognition motif-containing protein